MTTLTIHARNSEGLRLEATYLNGAVALQVVGPLPKTGAIVIGDDSARVLAACMMEWTDSRPEGP